MSFDQLVGSVTLRWDGGYIGWIYVRSCSLYECEFERRLGPRGGAAAAMRLVEQNKVLGLVLVAAYDDDLGDELERNSGYFSRPWDWHKIRSNAGFIGAGPSTHPSKRSASTRAVWCHLREPVFDVGTDVVTVGEMVSFHHFAPLPQHQCGSVSTAFKP
jgi:hypothetical protein